MAMKKQNSALLLLVAIVFLVVGYILYQEGKLSFPWESKLELPVAEDQAHPEDSSQDQLGDAVQEASPEEVQQKELQKSFALVLDDASECLGYKVPKLSAEAPVSVDTLLMQFQTELGPPSRQSDRWMNWQLRNKDGKERRLRLEVAEAEDGSVSRNLNYFSVDRDGQPIPIDIPDDR